MLAKILLFSTVIFSSPVKKEVGSKTFGKNLELFTLSFSIRSSTEALYFFEVKTLKSSWIMIS